MYEQAGFFKGIGLWFARWAIILGIIGAVALIAFQCFSPGAEAEPVAAEEELKAGPNRIEGWNELLNRLRGNE